MKHAILILAHKDFEQLHHLIEYFVKDCYVYVHIDKKAVITSEELHSIDSMPQVRAVYRKYKVHWGGFSILKTELFLLRQVLKDGDCDYVHLISGQDYPIKPLDKFLKFFEENKGKEFIRYANIPNPHFDRYTYARFQYYYPYDYINKGNKDAINFMQKVISWEHKLGIKRSIPDQFDRLYGSTQWFSITKSAVETLINYTNNHRSFYRRSRWTFAAEEYYVASVLLNICDKRNFVPSDLRFIIWKEENGNCPANLGKEHFGILASLKDFFFARKMNVPICKELIPLIDKYLICPDSSFSTMDSGIWNYDGFQKYSFDGKILAAIFEICKNLKISNVLDAGCGAGLYTSALRKRGIPTTGIDGNPYTPLLSSLLLPKGDEPCKVADLSVPIEVEEPFNLTLCMNLLSCIPKKKLDYVCSNLTAITGKYLLIIEDFVEFSKGILLMEEYEAILSLCGFKRHEMGTSIINRNCPKTRKIALLLVK